MDTFNIGYPKFWFSKYLGKVGIVPVTFRSTQLCDAW